MVETKNQDEHTLPTKRKLDSLSQDKKEEEEGYHDQPNKSQKLSLQPSSKNPETNPSIPEENINKHEAEPELNGDDEEEDDDGGFDDDEEEEEEENGEAPVVDRKGKGIMIEEEKADDDSSDDGSELDGDDDSELEDDPLAEVDLDNILPSRTRQRAVQPGVYIANDLANDDDDDDDDSDDSDDA